MMNLFKGPKRIWFGLGALLLWGVLGCENTVDDTPNNLPGEMSGDTGCGGSAPNTGSVEQAIPLGEMSGVDVPLNIESGDVITDIAVTVDVTHPDINKLRLTLIAPDETSYVLFDGVNVEPAADLKTAFPTQRAPVDALDQLIGQPAQGRWVLRAVDTDEGNADAIRQVNSWGLRVTRQAAFCGCDEPGAIYRLTQLELASLAGDENHPIVPLLNGNWANDIAKKEINIYLEVISSGRREMTMRVVSGLRATPVEGDAMSFDFGEAETCILPETGVEFLAGPMENGGYENQTSTAFNVAPGTPNERKICASDIPTPHTIPVRNLKLQAKFTQDCSQMIEGVALSGSLPADEVDRICMCQRIGGTAEDCEPLDPDFESDHGRCNTCNVNYESLGFLMTTLNGGVKLPAECEADPDVSEAGDELSIPGICITGRFEAERLDEVPANCPE